VIFDLKFQRLRKRGGRSSFFFVIIIQIILILIIRVIKTSLAVASFFSYFSVFFLKKMKDVSGSDVFLTGVQTGQQRVSYATLRFKKK
jgi:hypothetical protein